MPLDPSTAAFVYSCVYVRVLCSLSLSCSPFLPAFFLLPDYNGQTHNKEGKTRYVGRLTMEHTWARAGARLRWLWGGRRYRMVHRYEMSGGTEKNARERGERRKERNNALSLFCFFFFFSSLLFSSTAVDAARVPSSIPLVGENSGASATLSDLFAKCRTRPVTWYACRRKAAWHCPSRTFACAWIVSFAFACHSSGHNSCLEVAVSSYILWTFSPIMYPIMYIANSNCYI